jgi:hypothetical protein
VLEKKKLNYWIVINVKEITSLLPLWVGTKPMGQLLVVFENRINQCQLMKISYELINNNRVPKPHQ